ncbi:MAG: DUF924 family protein [Legionella sp.]|nr:DUF924 family protein [Legionella sp.]
MEISNPFTGSKTNEMIPSITDFCLIIYVNDTPQSFAYDGMALILAQEAIRRSLFAEPGLEDALDFEKQHFEIIERFGRYPHRNTILKRTSSDEEKEFLKQHPGF